MAFVNSTDGCATDFTLDFFVEYTPWPMVHLINAFTLIMITQSPAWTFIGATVWEIFERSLLIAGNGKYILFVGDASNTQAESCSDSIIGDLFHCYLGILLGMFFMACFSSPMWSIAYKVHQIHGYKRWWWARKILANFLTIPFFFSSVTIITHSGFHVNIIILIMLAFYPFAVLMFAYIIDNWMPEYIEFYWKNNRSHFYITHFAWAIFAAIIISSGTYASISVYYQSWAHAFIAILFAIVYGATVDLIDVKAFFLWLFSARTIFDALQRKVGYPNSQKDHVTKRFIQNMNLFGSPTKKNF